MDERRRKPRRSSSAIAEIFIGIERQGGIMQTRAVRLADSTGWGVGFETATPMVVGLELFVWGPGVPGAQTDSEKRRVQVVHCRLTPDGRFRTGCAFTDSPSMNGLARPRAFDAASFADLYEILQVHATADEETIHRVYRMLAQRYHPDNPETGNEAAFQAILEAYETLNDPERRAAYDLRYQAGRSQRWKIFEDTDPAADLESEKRVRAGVLTALYTKRRRAPEAAGMMVRELEDLLGVAREHLEFSLWYLRRKELIEGPQNGRYEITVAGVDEAEDLAAKGFAPKPISEDHRIEAPVGA
jgi:hypothetical protein